MFYCPVIVNVRKTNSQIQKKSCELIAGFRDRVVPVFGFAQWSKIARIFIRAGITHTSYNQDYLRRLEDTQTQRGKQKADSCTTDGYKNTDTHNTKYIITRGNEFIISMKQYPFSNHI